MTGTERGGGEKGERVESWRIRETDRQKSKQRFKNEKNFKKQRERNKEIRV
jgi:hypothetical protein